MDTQVMRYSFPCTVMGASSTVSVSLTTGMFSATSSGAPMFTFTKITLPSWMVRHKCFTFPALIMLIFFLVVSPLSYTYFATQRMPFPHISARLPSALYISISKSASSEGLMKITPSPPIPKCLSLNRFTISGFFSAGIISLLPST